MKTAKESVSMEPVSGPDDSEDGRDSGDDASQV
jgi:hypothetical protein